MAQFLFKGTLDFTDVRVRDLPLLPLPKALIVGIEDGNNYEILDAAYLIQYPFIDGFGFVKGQYFKLLNGFNLLSFDVPLRSKLRILPLRKQKEITVSVWSLTMPIYPDQPNPSSTSGTQSSVAAAITSTTLLPANNNRKALTVYNNSIATLYIGFGATVSATAFSEKIAANSLWEMPIDYDGPVVGIWTAATGNALVTEFV